jgi:galactose mutarotase-like enzyme
MPIPPTVIRPAAGEGKGERMIGQRTVDGFAAITVSSPRAELEAAFVPEAGMVGCSLLHRGEELLGQRGGVSRYVAERSTMGIPLLHPWANRLAARRFQTLGREVDLDAAQPPPSTDPNGLPIHGLLSAARGWQVVRSEPSDDGGTIEARFDFAAHESMMRAFPFAHEIGLGVTLAGSKLTISTSVAATGDGPVPVSFGFHPYFRLAGLDRSRWEVDIPVSERLALDERMLPTGEREPTSVASGPLASRTFDDAYASPPAGEPFAVAGGGRRIEVAFGSGYPLAQVYAPAEDDVIAIEPMTAPTNALVTGVDLPVAEPASPYTAVFSITVADIGD